MKSKAVFELADRSVAYSPKTIAELEGILDFSGRREDSEILLTGWGGPVLDETYLRSMPKLSAVFYAAGSVRPIVTESFWQQDIAICSAWTANARPVAEFTLAQIILALKHTGFRSRLMHQERRRPDGIQSVGAFGSVVGLVGLGTIGRLVAQYLKMLDVEILATDPYFPSDEAGLLGLRLVPLAELFSRSDVISLHAPEVDSTYGMITELLLRSMKPGATLINTSRGSLIDEKALIQVLTERSNIYAMLDVSLPDPPVPESPLYDLPNVQLTPHIAGSVGNECWRMGDLMLQEVRRYLAGQPLLHRLGRKVAELMT